MRPTIDTLMRTYPPHPLYPETGPRHLLLWSHHYERGMLTVARSKRALLDVWKTRWANDEAGTPLVYVDALVVSPPQRFREKYARDRYEYHKDIFARAVVGLLPDYRRFHAGALPPGVTFPCRNYQGRFPEQEEDKHHVYCQNCVEQYVAPWEDLFIKHGNIFERARPDSTSPLAVRDFEREQRRKAVLAARRYHEVPADPSKPLYIVTRDGNWTRPDEVRHVFHEVTEETYEHSTPEAIYLFFQGELQNARKDPDWMAPVVQSKKEIEDERRQREEKRKAEERLRQEDNHRVVQTIFGEGYPRPPTRNEVFDDADDR